LLSLTFFYHREQTLFLVLIPLLNSTGNQVCLIFTDIQEGFISFLNISVWLGFFCRFPFFFTQIFLFFSPGLYLFEQKEIQFWLSLRFFSLLCGSIFGFYFLLPIICKFFLRFEINNNFIVDLRFEPRFSQYLILINNLFFSLGFLSFLPLILGFCVRNQYLRLKSLVKYRKLAYFLRFVIGAFCSPPDIFSQAIVALPLIFFYEGTIFRASISNQLK
jgi:sec-independent protein translocase protein TatC